uniref:Uncharacterized protein n=1 Tax=Morchella brunnea TaxID=1174671 RepID=A0A8K1I8C7_9PEZI|nr:hypothetical protein LK370_mgp101 [Morchella brunnea]UBU98559.1 hypothetical protein [Morchella brunnea]
MGESEKLHPSLSSPLFTTTRVVVKSGEAKPREGTLFNNLFTLLLLKPIQICIGRCRKKVSFSIVFFIYRHIYNENLLRWRWGAERPHLGASPPTGGDAPQHWVYVENRYRIPDFVVGKLMDNDENNDTQHVLFGEVKRAGANIYAALEQLSGSIQLEPIEECFTCFAVLLIGVKIAFYKYNKMISIQAEFSEVLGDRPGDPNLLSPGLRPTRTTLSQFLLREVFFWFYKK